MRTDRYRYTEWRNSKNLKECGFIELYDHHKDPLETKNLSHLVEMEELIVKLRPSLLDGFPRLVDGNVNMSGVPVLSSWQSTAQQKKRKKKQKREGTEK
jgi:hypothetical protein